MTIVTESTVAVSFIIKSPFFFPDLPMTFFLDYLLFHSTLLCGFQAVFLPLCLAGALLLSCMLLLLPAMKCLLEPTRPGPSPLVSLLCRGVTSSTPTVPRPSTRVTPKLRPLLQASVSRIQDCFCPPQRPHSHPNQHVETDSMIFPNRLAVGQGCLAQGRPTPFSQFSKSETWTSSLILPLPYPSRPSPSPVAPTSCASAPLTLAYSSPFPPSS